MNKNSKDNIYNVKSNDKKQICVKISLFCGDKYLDQLSLMSNVETEKIDQITENTTNYKADSMKLFCNACSVSFETVQEMRKHQWTYKHRVNKGWIQCNSENEENDDSEEEIYNEEAFDEDVEVSNDDSEDDYEERSNIIIKPEIIENENVGLKFLSKLKSKTVSFHEACTFPTIYFQNSQESIIGIKRCILFNRKNKPECQGDLLMCVNTLTEVKKCAVFLYSGGSFAGAIFEGNKQILSKTFKRYTYRHKQGGSQVNKDNQGNFAKSAGASLRRVNTKRLIEDIFELLHQKWSDEINNCGLILIWSAKNQRNIFGHEGMLNQQRQKLSFDISKDPRVRFISARVSKVNSTTLLDIYKQMSTIEIYDAEFMSNNEFIEETEKSKPVKVEVQKIKKSKKKKTKKERVSIEDGGIIPDSADDEEEPVVEAVVKLETKEDVEIRNKMLNYVLNDSAEDLIPYINELKINKSCDEISSLLSAPLKTKNQSLLHIAITHDNLNVISPLLQLGCDPLHRNNDDETPYAMAIRQRNKVACTIMSSYMFDNPTQYDYFAAKFPGGKDPLKELERKRKEAEKKKQYKKDRKERLKLEEEERKKEAIEKCQRDQFLSLEDASKVTFIRKIQYDQRKCFMLCFQCAKDISDIVPFSYRDFSFCGMNCLKNHRAAKEK